MLAFNVIEFRNEWIVQKSVKHVPISFQMKAVMTSLYVLTKNILLQKKLSTLKVIETSSTFHMQHLHSDFCYIFYIFELYDTLLVLHVCTAFHTHCMTLWCHTKTTLILFLTQTSKNLHEIVIRWRFRSLNIFKSF